MIRYGLAVALWAVLAVPASCGEAEIPLRFLDEPDTVRLTSEFRFEDETGFVTLPVKAFGRELPMYLDSGATYCVVDKGLRDKLGTAARRVSVESYSGAKVEAEVFAPVPIHLGRLKVCDKALVVADLASCHDYAEGDAEGVIGLDFFSDHVVQIDYDARVVRVFEPGSRSDAWGDSFPLGHGAADVFMIGRLPGGMPEVFMVDSGGENLLSLPLFSGVSQGLALGSGIGCDISGHRFYPAAAVEGFAVGSTTYPALYFVSSAIRAQSVLGREFLSRHMATIDWPHSRIYLKPGRAFGDPARINRLGAFFDITSSSQIVVVAVAPGTAANAAGLKKDDLILALDGRPAASLSADDFLAYAGSTGTARRVATVRRGGQVLEIPLRPSASPRPAKVSAPREEKAPIVRAVILPENLTEEFRSAAAKAFEVQPGQVLQRSDLDKDVETMVTVMKATGYAEADVAVRVDASTETGRADVRYLIAAGPRHEYKAASLMGNRSFPSARLLELMKIGPGAVYSEAGLRRGLVRLRDFYRDEGFWDVDFGTPTVARRKGLAQETVQVEIEEGSRRRCGDMGLSGNTIFGAGELLKAAAYPRAKPCAADALARSSKGIQELYAERGYLRTKVSWKQTEGARGLLDAQGAIAEGPVVPVAEVVVDGIADPRRREAARRLVLVQPGEIFRASRVRKSKKRLEGFEGITAVDIDIEESRKSPGGVDVIFDVSEARPIRKED